MAKPAGYPKNERYYNFKTGMSQNYFNGEEIRAGIAENLHFNRLILRIRIFIKLK